jgi:hypothetical protein
MPVTKVDHMASELTGVAELLRRYASHILKDTCEIALITETASIGNLRDGLFCTAQHIASAVHPVLPE